MQHAVCKSSKLQFSYYIYPVNKEQTVHGTSAQYVLKVNTCASAVTTLQSRHDIFVLRVGGKANIIASGA